MSEDLYGVSPAMAALPGHKLANGLRALVAYAPDAAAQIHEIVLTQKAFGELIGALGLDFVEFADGEKHAQFLELTLKAVPEVQYE